MKYLFSSKDDKNNIYKQTEEDVSEKDKTKSAFYDIMDKNVKEFWLEGDGHTYLVDLKDGHFEVDGVPIWLHDVNEELKDFRLVYFRSHTHHFMGNINVEHQIDFCIGWQTNDKNGNNIQKILRIK